MLFWSWDYSSFPFFCSSRRASRLHWILIQGCRKGFPTPIIRVLITGGLADGPAVTRACLKCHPDAAQQVIHTAHWNWEGDPVLLPGRNEPVRVGKKNLINNFCIGVQSNWPACTSCHAGYGWVDENFDFSDAANVDCLVCHDWSGTYQKGQGGMPAEGRRSDRGGQERRMAEAGKLRELSLPRRRR